MRYIFCLISVATFIGCKRQTICEANNHNSTALIGFNIDWAGANIDPSNISNASIYAYSDDVATPYIKVSGNILTPYINLPTGVYSLLIFNDFVGDIGGINFSETTLYDDFTAEVIGRTSLDDIYYTPESGEIVAQEPQSLATYRIVGFEVTPEMVSCSYCEPSNSLTTAVTIEVAPTPTTIMCVVTLKVENLDNAYHVESTIRGLATGVYLASEDRFASSESTTLYNVELTDITYIDGGSDGIALGEMTTFGIPTDNTNSYEVEIDIILNSGELVSYTRDITDQIVEQSGSVIYIDLTSDENLISLPTKTSVGFGVESWGEKDQIHLK